MTHVALPNEAPPPEAVIDASVALAFVLDGEPHQPAVRQLLADLVAAGVRIISPPLFESEADSTIRRGVHQGHVTAERASELQAILDALPVQIVYEPAVRARARQIAEQFNQVRVYDSTYAALAELRGCDLWTADERFYNGVRAGLPFVRFVGEYGN